MLKHARLPSFLQKKRAQHQPAAEEKQERGRSRQDIRCQVGEEAEAASEKKPSSRKKPSEKKGKWGDFRGGFPWDPNPDVIL